MNPGNTPPNSPTPVTEAELQAFVDRQLTPERQRDIEAWLAGRPEEAQRVEAYLAQKQELRALFNPVLDEPVPERLRQAAQPRTPWYRERLVAGLAIALVSGAAGFVLGNGLGNQPDRWLASLRPSSALAQNNASGFAQRAAIAHAVFSPDQRRAVEINAEHEDQLITWLSRRMGTPMKPPHLQSLGYTLEGGRLLPGGKGPVAQFMYHDDAGARLTLYLSNDIASASPATATGVQPATAFRLAREGAVNTFYWVNGPFGYALSSTVDQAELHRVSNEVYRQLESPPAKPPGP